MIPQLVVRGQTRRRATTMNWAKDASFRSFHSSQTPLDTPIRVRLPPPQKAFGCYTLRRLRRSAEAARHSWRRLLESIRVCLHFCVWGAPAGTFYRSLGRWRKSPANGSSTMRPDHSASGTASDLGPSPVHGPLSEPESSSALRPLYRQRRRSLSDHQLLDSALYKLSVYRSYHDPLPAFRLPCPSLSSPRSLRELERGMALPLSGCCSVTLPPAALLQGRLPRNRLLAPP
jgi:hypothetical protein